MFIVGIDPGSSSGSITIFQTANGDSWGPQFVKLSETEHDVMRWLERFGLDPGNCFCFLEQVHSMPKQGVSSAFTFGRNYGFLRGLLISLKLPFEEIAPAKWQRALNCLSGGNKKVTKARAQQLFPRLPYAITNINADSLLIAEYGKRILLGRAPRSPSSHRITAGLPTKPPMRKGPTPLKRVS